MIGAADSGKTRVLIAGLVGAGVLLIGAGGSVAMRRRRESVVVVAGATMPVVGPTSPVEGPTPPVEPPGDPPSGAEPYATLGDPRPAEPVADGPAEPGRDEGDDT